MAHTGSVSEKTMIKKFIDKLLGSATAARRAKAPKFGKREEVGPAEHGIDPNLVDERALNVVKTLQQAGFQHRQTGLRRQGCQVQILPDRPGFHIAAPG